MRRIGFFVTIAALTLPLAARAQVDTTKPPADTTQRFQRLTGKVVDAGTGQPISGVGVQVVGVDSMRVRTKVDGSYTFPNAPTGPLTLNVQKIGYAPKTVTGVYLKAGEPLEVNITLDVAVLQAVQVSAEKEKGTASEAVNAQRTAVAVTSTITAEQIAKSPDGDAAQAMARVSGATVQDKRAVTMRGLSDRYTTTALNGARIPSPEPEKRVVPLDIFPSGLIQSITTAKTFTPDLPGDFSGGMVDIRTKEFPARRSVSFQLGSGYAAGATGSNLLSATSVGGERLGMVNHQRDLPNPVRALGSFQNINLTQSDINSLVGSFRDSWSPKLATGAPLINGSASIGGNDPVFGHRVGYLFSGTMSSGTDVKDGQERALAIGGSVRGSTVENDRFVGQSTSQGVLWGGLTNLSTLIGDNSRVSFNGLYNRSADNDSRVERGEFTQDGLPVKISRMQYVQRGVYSAQLAGEHQWSDAHRFDWSATASGVRRYEPDRSAFVQVIEHDTPGGPEVLRWLSVGSGGAVRSFSDLNEHSREASANYRYTMGVNATGATIKVGGLYRATNRDAESFSYAISANGASDEVRALSPEEIFDGRFSTPAATLFTMGPLSQGGSYAARDRLASGYAMAEVPFSNSIRLIGGARYEHDLLNIDATSTLGSPVATEKRWNDLLPSVALNWQMSDRQQLRVSASRTLARPEYRELTPIISRDVINGENLQGDEGLKRTNIANADVRWEMYPHDGELVSLAVFAKRFTNPIERVNGSGSGGTSYVFYTNAQSARDYGVELELRQNLAFLHESLSPFWFFGNVTAMQSRIQLYKNTLASATNLSRRLVGQAPYVVNAGLSYSTRSGGSTATLLYNRVGERITAAGSIPLPDVIEQPRNVIDLSLRIGVTRGVSARLDAKNLLDSPYEVIQGTVRREFYRNGRTVQAGFVWKN
ncbi:MAG TPA: TonB-dependent receptor [Gemmatimonadaceae bacterium]|nr:TonB-dependent receptor [Gemmatimonadaceae bacterium]